MKAKKVYEFIQKKSLRNAIKNDIGINKIAIDDILNWLKSLYPIPISDDTFKIDITNDNYIKIYENVDYNILSLTNGFITNNIPVIFPFDKLEVKKLILNKVNLKKLPDNIKANLVYINGDNKELDFKFPKYLKCDILRLSNIKNLDQILNKNTDTTLIIHNKLIIENSYISSLPNNMIGPKHILISINGLWEDEYKDKKDTWEDELLSNLSDNMKKRVIVDIKDYDKYHEIYGGYDIT